MKAIDPFASSHILLTEAGAPLLLEHIKQLAGELEPGEYERIEEIVTGGERAAESVRDALSTRLMECFRLTQSRGAFGLLYELNGPHLLVQVSARLRRYGSHADPGDVLQEVFFNVYRYPHRFDATREDAFRVWSAMIVRNTVLKHLRSLSRSGPLRRPPRAAGDERGLPLGWSHPGREPRGVRARLPQLPAALPAVLLDAL